MKPNVDSQLCSGTGLCENICPEVFELKDGVSTVKVDQVPEDAQETCREAADQCPTDAITIEE